MKQSPDLDRIKARHGDVLDLPPEDGLFRVALRIAELTADVAALRKLEHSYRTKARWQRKREPASVNPETGERLVNPETGERLVHPEAMSRAEFEKLLQSMQER